MKVLCNNRIKKGEERGVLMKEKYIVRIPVKQTINNSKIIPNKIETQTEK